MGARPGMPPGMMAPGMMQGGPPPGKQITNTIFGVRCLLQLIKHNF